MPWSHLLPWYKVLLWLDRSCSSIHLYAKTWCSKTGSQLPFWYITGCNPSSMDSIWRFRIHIWRSIEWHPAIWAAVSNQNTQYAAIQRIWMWICGSFLASGHKICWVLFCQWYRSNCLQVQPICWAGYCHPTMFHWHLGGETEGHMCWRYVYWKNLKNYAWVTLTSTIWSTLPYPSPSLNLTKNTHFQLLVFAGPFQGQLFSHPSNTWESGLSIFIRFRK